MSSRRTSRSIPPNSTDAAASARGDRRRGSNNQRDLLIKMFTAKDAYGYDAMTTYLPIDGLGINALPDSEKYKRGIKENKTGKTRTLGIWMSCPDCGFNRKFQEFIK